MPPRKLHSKHRKKPYSEAADDEKVVRNWHKTVGLFERGEYSSALLRAAICLELAVNFVIREELVGAKKLPIDFVNTLLKDANGIHRKFNGIFLPIMKEYEEYDDLKKLWKANIQKVNEKRNKVAHGGNFENKEPVKAVLALAYEAIMMMFDLFGSKKKLKSLE